MYFTGDGSGNMKDVGARVTAESEAGLGEFLTVAGSRTFQDAKVSFLPGMAVPERGLGLRQ